MPRLPQRPALLGGAPKCGNPVPSPGLAPSRPSSTGKNSKEIPGKAQAECRASAQLHSHQGRTQTSPPPTVPLEAMRSLSNRPLSHHFSPLLLFPLLSSPPSSLLSSPLLSSFSSCLFSQKKPPPPSSPAAHLSRNQPPIGPSRPTAKKKTALRKERVRDGAGKGAGQRWATLLSDPNC